MSPTEPAQGQAYLRLRIDAGQEPAEIENDIDVYVSLSGGDEDNLEPQEAP